MSPLEGFSTARGELYSDRRHPATQGDGVLADGKTRHWQDRGRRSDRSSPTCVSPITNARTATSSDSTRLHGDGGVAATLVRHPARRLMSAPAALTRWRPNQRPWRMETRSRRSPQPKQILDPIWDVRVSEVVGRLARHPVQKDSVRGADKTRPRTARDNLAQLGFRRVLGRTARRSDRNDRGSRVTYALPETATPPRRGPKSSNFRRIFEPALGLEPRAC